VKSSAEGVRDRRRGACDCAGVGAIEGSGSVRSSISKLPEFDIAVTAGSIFYSYYFTKGNADLAVAASASLPELRQRRPQRDLDARQERPGEFHRSTPSASLRVEGIHSPAGPVSAAETAGAAAAAFPAAEACPLWPGHRARCARACRRWRGWSPPAILYRREPHELARGLWVDCSKMDGPTVPVVYSTSFADPAEYFLATRAQTISANLSAAEGSHVGRKWRAFGFPVALENGAARILSFPVPFRI
jgi:hypothetical protein